MSTRARLTKEITTVPCGNTDKGGDISAVSHRTIYSAVFCVKVISLCSDAHETIEYGTFRCVLTEVENRPKDHYLRDQPKK